MEVFAVEAGSHKVRHLWQTDSRGGWSESSELGGSMQPGLVAARNRDGRLEVFGLASGRDTVAHCWQLLPNATNQWSGWVGLGGAVLPGLAVARNPGGRLEVFGINPDTHAANRICQAAAADSTNWTPWLDFGGNFKPGIAVGNSGDQRAEVFAVNAADSVLSHRWEDFPNNSDVWSAWATMGAATRPWPAVACNEDGDLEVFAVDATNSTLLRYRRQISSASDWLDWSSLDKPVWEFTARAWQVDEGLPDNLVQAIAQTPDGYLWVGTRAGLARFDGVQFSKFDTRTTPAIKNSSITALYAGGDGALWIGTGGGGLVRLKDGMFTHYGRADGLAGEDVRVISESKDGSLWIGTTTGMTRYRSGKFENYTHKDGLLSDAVGCIYQDHYGNLWIATGKGLNRLKKDGAMDAFTMPNGLPNDSVRVISQDHGGRIWIGSNNGLLWYDQYWTNHFYAYNTKYGLSDTFVSAICEGRDGNFWVGTYSGLNRFHDGRFYAQLDSEGLPFSRVNALLEDSEGDLWVGTQEGLIRLARKCFFTYTKQQGLSHNNIMSVLQKRDGSMCIGTWGGGLDLLRGEEVTAYAPTNRLSQDLILSLCEGRDGSIWVGADFDGGLTRLLDGTATHFGGQDGLIDARIQVLHEDRAGNLWVGTGQGLSCLKHGKFVNYTVRDGLAGNDVRAILEDKAGDLWFGTGGGLSRLRDGRFTAFGPEDGLSPDTVISLYEDGEGVLWFGTDGAGLGKYRNGQFTAYRQRQGLFSDVIFSILEDDQGGFWMSSPQGVFRVARKDLDALDHGRLKAVSSVVYGKSDGMESPQCNGSGKPSAWKSTDGRLWFPTTKGLATVDPKNLLKNPARPRICVEQLLADRKPLLDDAPDATPPGAPPTVTVPPGRGELEFHYTAPILSAPEKARFKYKLDGIDPDWTDAGSRRIAHYNNVPPGRYRFQVAVCIPDGVWLDGGATLGLVLQAHFWNTWWFQTLAVLLAVASASGAALYGARRRMKRKLEALEQRNAIERERGRIARDIHDDLGSSLTRIMLLGERVEERLERSEDVADQVRKIVNSARHTVQAVDEIVWAVNPENDTLDGLISYIGHYADELFEDSTVSLRLEVPMELPAIVLPAEVRHNLFLVVKEALHNVLKHSRASQVQVRVSATTTSLEFEIRDNGRGFDPGAPQSGNGLHNMRRRTEALNGRFEIATPAGGGATLKITLALDRLGRVARNGSGGEGFPAGRGPQK